jgi:hypothetical protein
VDLSTKGGPNAFATTKPNADVTLALLITTLLGSEKWAVLSVLNFRGWRKTKFISQRGVYNLKGGAQKFIKRKIPVR